MAILTPPEGLAFRKWPLRSLTFVFLRSVHFRFFSLPSGMQKHKSLGEEEKSPTGEMRFFDDFSAKLCVYGLEKT